jgi:hypothetical protein
MSITALWPLLPSRILNARSLIVRHSELHRILAIGALFVRLFNSFIPSVHSGLTPSLMELGIPN